MILVLVHVLKLNSSNNINIGITSSISIDNVCLVPWGWPSGAAAAGSAVESSDGRGAADTTQEPRNDVAWSDFYDNSPHRAGAGLPKVSSDGGTLPCLAWANRRRFANLGEHEVEEEYGQTGRAMCVTGAARCLL